MASKYNLKINFTEEDLKYIKGTGKKVVIVKESDDDNHCMAMKAASEFVTDVAWVTCNPRMSINVSWEDTYFVYASDTKIQNGATIETISNKAAEPKTRLYTFTKDGYFEDEPYGNAPVNTAYYVKNICGETETFGLAQSAKVSSTVYSVNPINAISMLDNDSGYFIPVEKVKVFLSANADNGKVISVIQSDVLVVDLTVENSQSISYDKDTGKFRLDN